MKLFPGKIGIISTEITQVLIDNEDIETDSPEEVGLDIEAVLKEYIRTDKELTENAKDLCEQRGLPFSSYPKVKRQLAQQRGFAIGNEALDYIMDQLIGVFMHSQFVEEIYAEDHELRRKMKPLLRKHMSVDEEVDEEVRRRIKNLEEGTQSWEVEYRRVQEQVMRKRRLSE